MPITFVETSSEDSHPPNDLDEGVFYQLLEAFLRLNESPSDEQIHALATALGTDPETLESKIYSMLADVLDDGDSDEIVEDDDSDLTVSFDDSDFDDSESPGELIEFPVQGSDPDNRAAEFDGKPDLEQLGQPDPYKEGAASDGAPDEELLETR